MFCPFVIWSGKNDSYISFVKCTVNWLNKDVLHLYFLTNIKMNRKTVCSVKLTINQDFIKLHPILSRKRIRIRPKINWVKDWKFSAIKFKYSGFIKILP